MIETEFRLLKKEPLTESGKLWKMVFEGPEIPAAPGQFVELAVEAKYLRRPISVSEYDKDKRILTLVIADAGEGTHRIIEWEPGKKYNMLAGLGNGFLLNPPKKNIIIIGGGVGYAPLVGLHKKLSEDKSLNIISIFGFNRGEDVPHKEIDRMRKERLKVEVCTMSGEVGYKGNPLEMTDAIVSGNKSFIPEFFYICGPMQMMKAACLKYEMEGQLSLEARMGCGFGACMGCSIKTADGTARICKEGPVFYKSQIMI